MLSTAPSPSSEDIHAQIEAIWREALERPIKDATASFFDNEGDSLGATIVLISLKDRFGVDISLEEFFDAPTIPGLAAAVLRHRWGKDL